MSAFLRAVQPDDADALYDIELQCSSSPWSMQQFQRLCEGDRAPGTQATVLQTGRDVAGFVIYNQIVDTGCILNIAVHPQSRRLGYGRQLLLSALDAMRADDARCCQLEVRAGNMSAIHLYEQQGFRRDGVRRDYYPAAVGREDAVLMSRHW